MLCVDRKLRYTYILDSALRVFNELRKTTWAEISYFFSLSCFLHLTLQYTLSHRNLNIVYYLTPMIFFAIRLKARANKNHLEWSWLINGKMPFSCIIPSKLEMHAPVSISRVLQYSKHLIIYCSSKVEALQLHLKIRWTSNTRVLQKCACHRAHALISIQTKVTELKIMLPRLRKVTQSVIGYRLHG